MGGRAAPGAPVTAVSRSLDKLDVFVVGADGGIWTAAWEPDFTDWWHGWWRIGSVAAPQGAFVGAVSRSTDKLDIFVTDSNGVIQTAAWEPDFTDGWHGWWELNGGRAAGVEFNVLMLSGPLLVQPVIQYYANVGGIGGALSLPDLGRRWTFKEEKRGVAGSRPPRTLRPLCSRAAETRRPSNRRNDGR